MDKRFVGILVGLIVILGAIFIFTQNSNNNSSGGSGKASNHITGNSKSKVKLLEYGDYQCPVCESYEPVMDRIRSHFDKQIAFQFKNLPLVQLHPNAFSAARAAEAASLQGKFWQMHDMLYRSANWQAWTGAADPKPLFESYAQQLKLNVNQFKNDYGSDGVNGTVNADLAEFKRTGQELATPTFYLAGHYIDNKDIPNPSINPNATYKKFGQLIKAELAKH